MLKALAYCNTGMQYYSMFCLDKCCIQVLLSTIYVYFTKKTDCLIDRYQIITQILDDLNVVGPTCYSLSGAFSCNNKTGSLKVLPGDTVLLL